jgi:ElaB/YqjD/DUF883 family membrane-anchored ribosome-binding protein
MINQMQEFVAEQAAALGSQLEKMRKDSMETVREAAVDSASGLKSLKSPVRTLARSGIKITSVSQTAVASLIELQSDMLTSAISAAALRLERASRADNIVELVRDQFEMIPATRDRLVEDAHRAALIFKHAGRDLRGVAANLYERVAETAEENIPEVTVTKRRAKRAVRKTKTAVRKTKTAVRKTAKRARKTAAEAAA